MEKKVVFKPGWFVDSTTGQPLPPEENEVAHKQAKDQLMAGYLPCDGTVKTTQIEHELNKDRVYDLVL